MVTTVPRRRHLVWPIILIGLGVILLLQNFGLLPWGLWGILARFWPVILILIGIELLLSRSNPWLAAVLAVTSVVAVIGAGVVFAATGYNGSAYSSPFAPAAAATTQHLDQPLDQARRSTVDIQFGAGELYLASLPAESDNVMEGDFTHSGGREVRPNFRCREGDCTLRLSPSGQHAWVFGRHGTDSWRVNLTPRIPLDLRLQSGASRIDLDLSTLQVTSLRLDVGASNGIVRLPQGAGTAAVTVKAGAADLEILVPPETAARIHARGGLSTYQIDEQRFPRQGEYYTSPDYAGAVNRADIEIDTGVSTIKIR